LKKYRQLTIGLAVALVALYYTLRNVSLDEVAGSFKEMDHIYIIPAVLIIALGYVFRAYRWQVLLEPTLKVDVLGLYSPMMVGFMGNFLPARAAEVLRPYLLAKKYNGVVNVGFNPTFDRDTLNVEAHIFDFEKKIYGQEIEVVFIRRIRSEIKFDSSNQLVEQIQKDIEAAKTILADLP
jgi:hypothetical protein